MIRVVGAVLIGLLVAGVLWVILLGAWGLLLQVWK